MLSKQAQNAKKAAEQFAAETIKAMGLPPEASLAIKVAFISGQLNICGVLAMHDGAVSPSKLGAAIKEYGVEELGLRVGRIGDGQE